jgi:hypothetical protein
MEPTNEYLKNILRFVSRPERNSNMIEARVAMPYSAGEVASIIRPSLAMSARRLAPWKRPPAKMPSPRPIPPSAQGPMTIPAASSPRMEGIFIQLANAPPSRAANMITPICRTRNIISSTRGNPKFGYGGGPPSCAAKTPNAAIATAPTKNIFLFFIFLIVY